MLQSELHDLNCSLTHRLDNELLSITHQTTQENMGLMVRRYTNLTLPVEVHGGPVV